MTYDEHRLRQRMDDSDTAARVRYRVQATHSVMPAVWFLVAVLGAHLLVGWLG